MLGVQGCVTLVKHSKLRLVVVPASLIFNTGKRLGSWGLGVGGWGLGVGVWGLGFGVWGLGFGLVDFDVYDAATVKIGRCST